MRPLHAQDARDGTYSVLVSEIDVGGIHDQARRQVARGAHDERVRGVADAHQGSETAGTAGGLGFSFRSVRQGLRCAIAVQQAFSGIPEQESRPRVGLHVGEMTVIHGVLEGPVLAFATQLAMVAHSGEILVSGLARELARDSQELAFEEGQEVKLPGLGGHLTVHSLSWGDGSLLRLRVVLADDAALVRDGVAALLRESGVEVVATAGDAGELYEAVGRHRPDVALIDIRMPPSYTDEGLVAAEHIRATFPGVGVLVLSQHLDARYALRVSQANPASRGYLLKDRVTDSQVLLGALRRIATGGCVIDESIAEGLVVRASALARLDELTERERAVLALIAEGLSNRAIAERLVVTPKTVETHIGQIFLKLGLREAFGEDRRVAAVLAFLQVDQPG
jgi:DNA-binding NarL/FixJ family response regulator